MKVPRQSFTQSWHQITSEFEVGRMEQFIVLLINSKRISEWKSIGNEMRAKRLRRTQHWATACAWAKLRPSSRTAYSRAVMLGANTLPLMLRLAIGIPMFSASPKPTPPCTSLCCLVRHCTQPQPQPPCVRAWMRVCVGGGPSWGEASLVLYSPSGWRWVILYCDNHRRGNPTTIGATTGGQLDQI